MQKRVFGLLGYPLSHSFSRGYFTEKFEKENINDAEYVNFEEADLHMFLSQAMHKEDLAGFNVTIPYKEGIFPLLDSVSEEASWIGAINTVKRTADGKMEGHNTDVIGFRESLVPLLQPHQIKALIFGTGGASKAVKFVLDGLGISPIFVSRYKQRGHLTYEQITEEVIGNYHLLINTTPLGTYPNVDAAVDIPYQAITEKHLCYDLVYNPEKTKFLQLAEAQGATIKNGYEMLVLQAEASWKIWNE